MFRFPGWALWTNSCLLKHHLFWHWSWIHILMQSLGISPSWVAKVLLLLMLFAKKLFVMINCGDLMSSWSLMVWFAGDFTKVNSILVPVSLCYYFEDPDAVVLYPPTPNGGLLFLRSVWWFLWDCVSAPSCRKCVMILLGEISPGLIPLMYVWNMWNAVRGL